MQQLYLTRRNLQTLLNKLDRNLREPGISKCTIVKQDTVHPKYPSTDVIQVTALEDAEYYSDRGPGEMHPVDAPKREEKLPLCDCGCGGADD